MSDEYAAHWNMALSKAGPSPAARIWALVNADFDRRICTKRKLAAWCAFWGEAKSRPTYQALCGSSDMTYQQTFVDLCAAMKAEADYHYDADTMALAICSMMEGLWFRLMMNDGLTREAALAAAITNVVAIFPRHLSMSGPLSR